MRTRKARRLTCTACGVNPRHGKWLKCWHCMQPIWRAASQRGKRTQQRMRRARSAQ